LTALQKGLPVAAAGTRPTALRRRTLQTAKKRNDMVMHDLKMIGPRALLCRLHARLPRTGVPEGGA